MSAAGSTSSLFGAGAAAGAGVGALPRKDANAFVAPEADGEIVRTGFGSGEKDAPKVEEGEEEKKLDDGVADPNPLKPPSLGTGGACEELVL